MANLSLGIDPAAGHPERALALSYAPAAARHGVAALLALDATLARLTRGTRDAMVARLRLAWWRDALIRLDTAPPPGQPILEALASAVMPHGVSGTMLATIVDGWEVLLEDGGALGDHAEQRGATLFEAAARGLGASDGMAARAGEGWALAELAVGAAHPGVRDAARGLAEPILADVMRRRWSRAGRPIGALALSGRMDLAGDRPGSPRRVARLFFHRVTGR